ncbi:MAG: PfkB family carbohydrate kinase [candidate division KSB1 bacterium]|nr:PfkB family carbohydrate kinase [candidate division KSB1 bacterium]MDZ7399376.1 PfkB family carbohydrate kinase [candidate division KSB1 bacterium]
MKIAQLAQILEKIHLVKVAVYGDFALDAYWFLDPRGGEISAETGLHSQAVKKHYYTLGGAANVVANLAALEPAEIKVIGVIGNDIFGREMIRQFVELGVNHDSLVIQNENFDTVVFSKIVLEGKEQPRIDFGFFNQRSPETDDKIITALADALNRCDALIFNQQVPNSLSNEKFIQNANALFDQFNDKVVLLDSRHYGHRFKNIYRKTNAVEAARLNGITADVLDQIDFEATKIHAQKLFDESGKPVFITRGSKGILVVDQAGSHEIPGIQFNKPIDPVGAGDTVVSALALCLGAGFSPVEAAEFANLAAAVTVQKLFMTGTASGKEILDLCREIGYI